MPRVLVVAVALVAILVGALAAPAQAQDDGRPTNWLGERAPAVQPGAPQPAGPAPTLTVTPDTGLVDGQEVQVTGTGFTPLVEVLIWQCRDGLPPDAGCPPFFSAFALADASGAIDIAIRVRAVPSPFFDPFDCRAIACNVTATSAPFIGPTASAPIAFDPGGPLVPPPVMRVTPSTGLRDGQSVAVDITGFFPGQQVAIAQCTDDPFGVICGEFFEIRTADGAGEVHTSFIVRRIFGGLIGEPIDCLATPCFLATGGLLDEQPTARVDLAFARNAPIITPIAQAPTFAG